LIFNHLDHQKIIKKMFGSFRNFSYLYEVRLIRNKVLIIKTPYV